MATGACSFCRGMKDLRHAAPCGCLFCNIQCARDYILRTYANRQAICPACNRPFPAAFLTSYFGTLQSLEDEVRARSHPARPYVPHVPAPVLMLHCDICKQQYSETMQWSLPCGHTYCRPCLLAKIKSGTERSDFLSICCPVDNIPIEVEQVRALTCGNQDLWMAYMSLVPLQAVARQGESSYQCPNHPCFRVAYEAGVPSAKCPLCPTAICLACKKPFAQGHTC